MLPSGRQITNIASTAQTYFPCSKSLSGVHMSHIQSLTVKLNGRVFRQLLFRNLGNGFFRILSISIFEVLLNLPLILTELYFESCAYEY